MNDRFNLFIRQKLKKTCVWDYNLTPSLCHDLENAVVAVCLPTQDRNALM